MKKFLFFISKTFYLLGFLLISCSCCNLFDNLENDFNTVKSELKIQNNIVLSGLKILGEGYWGKVFKIDENSCLKIIKKKVKILSNVEEEKDIQEEQELSISNKLKNEKIKGIQKIEATSSTLNYIFIKSKFYEGPTLENYIEKKRYENGDKKNLILKHFLQIVKALKNLHNNNYVHLDLKSDNLIFTDNKCNELIIIDLGTARMGINNQDMNKEQKEIIGSKRNYSYNVANAIINKKGYSGTKYDIWCLGLILYHMYFGEELFPKYDRTNILNTFLSFGRDLIYIENILKNRTTFDIKNNPKMKNLEEDIIYFLLTKILTKNDKERCSLDDIIKKIEENISS